MISNGCGLFICISSFAATLAPAAWSPTSPASYDVKYSHFSEVERREMLEETKKMFQFGYDNYMKHAFPADELNPIDCNGRGPDVDRSNININDVLGDYCLTLVDSLDTLAIMGNASEFQRAVQLVISTVSFDRDNTVQVFEATIRILGALISAHLIVTDRRQPFGAIRPPDYDNQLLHLAHDLATRLLPAFEGTATGIPHPRVNLKSGAAYGNQTCTSGAGSLLLEFGMLTRLLNDPVFESVARRANRALWRLRHRATGLFGNVVDIQTGEWVGTQSGLGAGLDSFYEYLLKAYILFGRQEDLKMFNESYTNIKEFMRRGREMCQSGVGDHPLYVNVNMKDGSTHNTWIDSLQAAFAGLQVLNGDIDEAICAHAVYYSIWKRFGVLPERYNWYSNMADVRFYPLRPELMESTYLLYHATKNPFYLHVGRDILLNINKYAKAECGYATIHDVDDMSQEDRMESFFLSETCKYLYLLFDEGNHINRESERYVFTTEGHIFPLDYRLLNMRSTGSAEEDEDNTMAWFFEQPHRPHYDVPQQREHIEEGKLKQEEEEEDFVPPPEKEEAPGHRVESFGSITFAHSPNSTWQCSKWKWSNRLERPLPLAGHYLRQLDLHIGVYDNPKTMATTQPD